MSKYECEICGKIITNFANYGRHIRSCLNIDNKRRSVSMIPTLDKKARIKNSDHVINGAISILSNEDIDITCNISQNSVLKSSSKKLLPSDTKCDIKNSSNILRKQVFVDSSTNINIPWSKTRRQCSQIRPVTNDSGDMLVHNVPSDLTATGDKPQKDIDTSNLKKESRVGRSLSRRKNKDSGISGENEKGTMITNSNTKKPFFAPDLFDIDFSPDMMNVKTRLRSSFSNEGVHNVDHLIFKVATKQALSENEQNVTSISNVKTRKQKSLSKEDVSENDYLFLCTKPKKRREKKTLKRSDSCVNKGDFLSNEMLKTLEGNSMSICTSNSNCGTRPQRALCIDQSIGDNYSENKKVTEEHEELNIKNVIDCDIDTIKKKCKATNKRFSENVHFGEDILTTNNKKTQTNDIIGSGTDCINISGNTRQRKSALLKRSIENNNIGSARTSTDDIIGLDSNPINTNGKRRSQKSMCIKMVTKSDNEETNSIKKEHEGTNLNDNNIFSIDHDIQESQSRVYTGVTTRLREQMDYSDNIVKDVKLSNEYITEMKGVTNVGFDIRRSTSTRKNGTTQSLSAKRKSKRCVKNGIVNNEINSQRLCKDIDNYLEKISTGKFIDHTNVASFKSPDCVSDDTLIKEILTTTANACIATDSTELKVPMDMVSPTSIVKPRQKGSISKTNTKKCRGKVKGNKNKTSSKESFVNIIPTATKAETCRSDITNNVTEHIADLPIASETTSTNDCDLNKNAAVTVFPNSTNADLTSVSNTFRHSKYLITALDEGNEEIMERAASDDIACHGIDFSEDNLSSMLINDKAVKILSPVNIATDADMATVILEISEEKTTYTSSGNYINSQDTEMDLFTVVSEKNEGRKSDSPSENICDYSSEIFSEKCEEIPKDVSVNNTESDDTVEKDHYTIISEKDEKIADFDYSDENLFTVVSEKNDEMANSNYCDNLIGANDYTVISEKEATISLENIDGNHVVETNSFRVLCGQIVEIAADKSIDSTNNEYITDEDLLAVLLGRDEEMTECENATENVSSIDFTTIVEEREVTASLDENVDKEDLLSVIQEKDDVSQATVEMENVLPETIVTIFEDLPTVVSQSSDEQLSTCINETYLTTINDTESDASHMVAEDSLAIVTFPMETSQSIISPNILHCSEENACTTTVTVSNETKGCLTSEIIDRFGVNDKEREDTQGINTERTELNISVQYVTCGSNATDTTEYHPSLKVKDTEETLQFGDYDIIACTTDEILTHSANIATTRATTESLSIITETEIVGSSLSSLDGNCIITDVELGLSALRLNLPNDETNRKKLRNIYRQLTREQGPEGAATYHPDTAPNDQTAGVATEKRVAMKRKHEEYRTDETDRASRQHESLFKCEICLETVDSRNQLETHRLLHSMDASYKAYKSQSTAVNGVAECCKQVPRLKRSRPLQDRSDNVVGPVAKRRKCDKCLKVTGSNHRCDKDVVEDTRLTSTDVCDGRFMCTHCVERPSFADRDCYLTHVMSQCRAVKEKQERLLEKHFPSQYGCGTCGLMFKTSTRLNTHKETAHRPKELLAH